MDPSRLIGQTVMDRRTKRRGKIIAVNGSMMEVSFYGDIIKYLFPSAFASYLLLQDGEMQEAFAASAYDASFENIKKRYYVAVKREIEYLKSTGGKIYRIIDGELIGKKRGIYLYSFETDTEYHFPDGTVIKLRLPEQTVLAYIISCEDFTLTFQTLEYIGDKVETLEFTAEPWQLLQGLLDRISELNAENNPIAYELACKGRMQIEKKRAIYLGQNTALQKALSNPITIIWGPPGTGKTTTLAQIAMEAINSGKRVLMLSYSNVSVDGALLKVASMAEQLPGQVLRYGYPRTKELLESKTLTSYAFVLYQNPDLAEEYRDLLTEKRKLRKKDPKRVEINEAINKIRSKLIDKERALVQNASFIATTVSKAIVDKAIYGQTFDVVIFDEASMAFVPQVIFAAGLARNHFCCLGDFRQLPAIVQNPEDSVLSRDIFEFTGVTEAVENGYGHNWLVMLNIQHRMHPYIAEFVSKYMYEGMLYSSEDIYEHCKEVSDLPPLKRRAMGMIDLSTSYSVCIKTMDGSHINLLSAMMCLKLAELFAGKYEVGIISPYSAQARLILAMIRDIQERNKKFSNITSATVHQFQGSEKAVIIYDAVDCFRMPYPGSLLTTRKNDIANRLFNVALTRTCGKFILVVNKDYMFQKKISKDLLFTKAMEKLSDGTCCLSKEEIIDNIGDLEGETPEVFLGDRDEEDSWERYLKDIQEAKTEIIIDMPGPMDDDEDAIEEFLKILHSAKMRGVSILIRVGENVTLPKAVHEHIKTGDYITTPFTMVDRKIIWFGEPIETPDFFSEGIVVPTKLFPCLRFWGYHTARMIKAIFEIPSF